MPFSTSAFRQLSDGNPTGTVLGLGSSTDAIGFYGAQPQVQFALGSSAIATLTTLPIAASTFSGTFGVFASSSQAQFVLNTCIQLISTGLFRQTP